jgi:hypothetical protein
MLEVKITEGHLKRAKMLDSSMGTLRNSITNGEGNLSGFLGEVIVGEILKARHDNTYDYDLVLSTGETVDVKTKRTNFPPKYGYDCSVAAFNTKQKCDYYAFVRVKNDLTTAWVLGFYPKQLYFEHAKFHRKGEFDESNKFTFKADCYNLPISGLRELI